MKTINYVKSYMETNSNPSPLDQENNYCNYRKNTLTTAQWTDTDLYFFIKIILLYLHEVRLSTTILLWILITFNSHNVIITCQGAVTNFGQ